MTLVMVLLTIAVVGGVSAVVAGVVSGGLSEPSTPIPVRALPPGPLTGQDVADLRFVQAFRGYRMDQVDAAMDSLAAEVERLRALVPAGLDEARPLNGSLPPLPERPEVPSDDFDAVLAEPEDVLAAGPVEGDADGTTGERARLPSDAPRGRD